MLRNKLGLSQKEFCDILMTSKSHLAMAEIDQRRLPTESGIIVTLIEEELEQFQAGSYQVSELELSLIRRHIKLCDAKISRLELSIEQLQATRETIANMLFICQQARIKRFLPEKGFIYDVLAIIERKIILRLDDWQFNTIKLKIIQLEGLKREKEVAEKIIS